ncbi:hypothetical protein GOV05_02330 [Candidatus Woesearchaeota archaeon]|nr:hypothetical protein [Candidatus Woesearchaeota archaeon]
MFEKIIRDIQELRVQGAENVAKAAIKALRDVYLKKLSATENDLLLSVVSAKKRLENTRPTEPALRNTLKFLLYQVNEHNIKNKLKQNIELATKHFSFSDSKIAKIGANKIQNGSVVFTHCHSNTVMRILKAAKNQGKKFEVYNTETRPNYQGRITAKELVDAGIKVTYFVDAAAKNAIKKADLVLFGADAITTEGNVVNKIGSGLFAEFADKYDVPVYAATNSWKFDPKSVFGFDEVLEERNKNEVWKDAPKGLKIKNVVFELVESVHVQGVISEVGIYKPESFVMELERFYPFMFKN